jgi:hypothetical protein
MQATVCIAFLEYRYATEEEKLIAAGDVGTLPQTAVITFWTGVKRHSRTGLD